MQDLSQHQVMAKSGNSILGLSDKINFFFLFFFKKKRGGGVKYNFKIYIHIYLIKLGSTSTLGHDHNLPYSKL
jgi:hypothetical protein